MALVEKENVSVGNLSSTPSKHDKSTNKSIASVVASNSPVRRSPRRAPSSTALKTDREKTVESSRKRKRRDEEEQPTENLEEPSPSIKRRKVDAPAPESFATPSKSEGAGRKFVNKIITRTQSISNFVRNTPLKFGSRKRSLALSKGSDFPANLDDQMEIDLDTPPADTLAHSSSTPSMDGALVGEKMRAKHATLQHTMSLRSVGRIRPMMQLKPAPFSSNFSPMISEHPNWILELGSSDVLPFTFETELGIKRPETSASVERWYTEIFAGKEHANFVAEDELLGPVSISVLKEDGAYKAVIRTSAGEEKVSAPVSVVKSAVFPKQGPKALLKALAPALHLHSVRQIKDEKHESELRLFEANEVHVKFKWGVLYCKKGQTDENAMFQNRDTSPQFEAFLKVLGERVSLQGFKDYSGGLDTTRNTTGTESVYTRFHGQEIMYHVSTMIPYTEDCAQQLERKRHIGNDIVVIVFQDGVGDTYVPNTITTQFQHILAVVQVEEGTGINGVPARFRVQFARKEGVPSFEPALQAPAVFESGAAFREFFLTKLVNGERASLRAPVFERAISRTRSGFLQLYNNQYPKQK